MGEGAKQTSQTYVAVRRGSMATPIFDSDLTVDGMRYEEMDDDWRA